jgi:hypothetical protein
MSVTQLQLRQVKTLTILVIFTWPWEKINYPDDLREDLLQENNKIISPP